MQDPRFTLQRGDAPRLISIPHLGAALPEDQGRRDSGWPLDRLGGFAQGLGAALAALLALPTPRR